MTQPKSRTYRSMQNGLVGLGVYLINLILSFVSRKVYLNYLGTELLGLNTTAHDLLGFLNLAELGIGTAIACTLFKPLADKDTETINEIVSLQGWLYRKIALIVGAAAIVLMAFFPLIFHKTNLPLGFAYLSFGVFLIGSLLSYFVNYQTIVISANQKDFKVHGCVSATNVFKTICQICAVIFLPNPYIWWCAIELAFSVLSSYLLHIIVKKDSPYLNTNIQIGRQLRGKYPEVITKVKQLFVHRISSFVLNQTGSIIMFAFTSLSMVTLVGNYNAIINSIRNLINAAIGNIGASVGNLLTENDKDKTMSVFEELFSIRFFLAALACFGIVKLSSPFVALWLGKEYILGRSTIILLAISIYISLTRITVDEYIYAKGLYQDIWAPIVESVLNISASIGLGAAFGVNGVLAGGIISQFCIVLLWKPYFLFTKGLNEPILKYVWMYSKHIVAFAVCYALTSIIIHHISIDPYDGFLSWATCAGIYALIFGAMLYFTLYFTTKGAKLILFRVLTILRLTH